MAQKARLLSIAPQLVVKDVVQTAEYYRDVLGFSILGYFWEPPVYAMVIRDGIEIHFGRADGKALNPVSEVRKEGVDIVLWVDDIDALFLELHAKQANIVEGIVPRSYGREIVIRDCNGYLIALVA